MLIMESWVTQESCASTMQWDSSGVWRKYIYVEAYFVSSIQAFPRKFLHHQGKALHMVVS